MEVIKLVSKVYLMRVKRKNLGRVSRNSPKIQGDVTFISNRLEFVYLFLIYGGDIRK
ncbi:hypothetical protein [Candidatus Nitrosocosmicus sp. R]